ncbi:MAG: 6-carboxyhexanoate--CoA ligase [Desulfuromonadales bacterium]|nr:6-carboxyhexanoate--CoA ligase [Desulfuromonadales bacterium]
MNYSIKMRAEKDGRHISGAERIVRESEIDAALNALVKRAQNHANGTPDSVSIKISKIDRPVQIIPSLSVIEPEIHNIEEAKAALLSELALLDLPGEKILDMFYPLENMRGAVLLDMNTLERLEPDRARGLRAANMDFLVSKENSGARKNHFKEALCLASKVANCPYIAGELCASDDPDYTTGYFASKTRGYVRIPHIKKAGEQKGGRIFLFSGEKENIEECIDYIENQPVMIKLNK